MGSGNTQTHRCATLIDSGARRRYFGDANWRIADGRASLQDPAQGERDAGSCSEWITDPRRPVAR